MSHRIILDSEPAHFGPFEWFRNTCNAARCRTPERINFFIQLTVPALSSLLCITCSTDAHGLMTRRHPTLYRDIKDERGENIGMWLWMYDLHNDVNRKLGKEEFPLEDAYRIYNPILAMTTAELEAQFKAAMDPSTMSGVPIVEFTDDSDPDDDDTEPDTNDEPVPKVSPSDPKTVSNNFKTYPDTSKTPNSSNAKVTPDTSTLVDREPNKHPVKARDIMRKRPLNNKKYPAKCVTCGKH